MTNSVSINRLCIIGVGLIGGSVARALRAANAVGEIVGASRNQQHLDVAKKLGVVDEATTDFKSAAQDADVILIATPLGAMPSVFMSLRNIMSDDRVITDVGSAKQCVIDQAQEIFGKVPAGLVPAHPIAGIEKSGVEASIAELFQDRRVILTPPEKTSPNALNTVRNMWQACGAEVIEMQAQHHDEVLAATSHLPHMLAYALVDTLARKDDKQEIFDYAAGGFRDFTRIASSDPTMWHDICVSNREELVKVLRAFNLDLHRLTEAIEQGDSEFIKATFVRAKKARDQFCG